MQEYPHTGMKGQKIVETAFENHQLCPAVNEVFNRLIDKNSNFIKEFQ